MNKEIQIMTLGRNRNIVDTNKWIAQVDVSHQFHIIERLKRGDEREGVVALPLIEEQIKHKIIGYKYQDIKKGLFCDTSFVCLMDVYSKLIESQYQCYYCKEYVHILYSKAREPKQWTLERLDNAFGHNRDNVVISCLHCNLCRKTMYHERFSFTKQMNLVKLE